VFVSVDESTGKSTISFHPADVGSPVQHEDDKTGAEAMKEARSISEKFPGCTVHGPHFHTARPPGRPKFRRSRPVIGAGGTAGDDSGGSNDSED
jgi:hypothetical protein